MPARKKTHPVDESGVPECVLTGQSFKSDIAVLQEFLLANTQKSVRISAKNLTRSDSRLFQYLIAATASWRERDLSLALTHLPNGFDTHFANLGIRSEMIIREAVE